MSGTFNLFLAIIPEDYEGPPGGGNGMVSHYSGTALDVQTIYFISVKQILDNYLNEKTQDLVNVSFGIGGTTRRLANETSL